MSTRSTVHFQQSWGSEPVTEAIIYRHSDGYPSVAGADIFRFFTEVQNQTTDTRFTDASYLAAKYVVWLAGEFRGNNPLDFLSVGVCAADPGDIAFRYIIDCSKVLDDGWPDVRCETYVGFGQNIADIRTEMLMHLAS
jgi:hypothetical protein